MIVLNKQEKYVAGIVMQSLKELGDEGYIVGGFVRDKLLGRENKDIDFVCLENGIALAEKTAQKLNPVPEVHVFRNFGTAHIKTADLELEFVGARKESYRYDSRKPEIEKGTLDDDQNRRDFTMNTLAISLQEENFGQIMDPFDGLEDLKNKIIRTPLQPDQTYSDDPLRMMRAIRFATQLDFRIEEESFTSIARNKERIKIISQERITEELNKIMQSATPSTGFKLLKSSGLLSIILPELLELEGTEYIDGIGHKDNFYHTLEVLDNVASKSDDLWLRWAALLHDIAKPATKKFDPDHGWTFHGHEWLGGKMVPRIFKKLRLPQNEKMRFVQKLVQLHLRPISLTKEEITDSAMRRLLFDAGDELDDLMILCNADITSKNPNKVKKYRENFRRVEERLKEVEENDKIRNWQPPITGEVIMKTFGLSPGRMVGDIKLMVREAILDGKIPNEYQAAFNFMLDEAGKRGIRPVDMN